MQQKELLTSLCENNKDAVIIGSIGSICYDLTDIEHPNKILVRGAMGAVLGIGLGYALSSDRKVIVIIGEGSLLMKLGSLSTILKHNLPNLEIHVMNNGCYHSCGGQTNNFEAVKKLLPKSIHVHNLLPKNRTKTTTAPLSN